jgi:hypothetical protein
MAHAREDPGDLKAAPGGIAESLSEWAAAFVEAAAAKNRFTQLFLEGLL